MVESTGLEHRQGGNLLEGSNPSLSAVKNTAFWAVVFIGGEKEAWDASVRDSKPD